jgi:hypothetical protein
MTFRPVDIVSKHPTSVEFLEDAWHFRYPMKRPWNFHRVIVTKPVGHVGYSAQLLKQGMMALSN